MGKEHDKLMEMIQFAIMEAYENGNRSELTIDTIGGAVKIEITWEPETENGDEEHG